MTFPTLLMAILPGAEVPAAVDYLREVKPLLAARCFACHAAIKQKGGLRVDTALLLREGGDKGAAITPGKGRASLLVQRILGQGGLKRMPPEHEGEALKPAEVALLVRWIDQGALAPADEQPETDPADHWAFKKPTRPPVPSPTRPGWARNAVDAFISEAHDKNGLVPQLEVGKRLLLRRVTLDLIGLPPTQEETDAFLSDGSPDAYEKVVNRLLASSQHGERWGRHWMDIWRYSDWWGLGAELRNSQRHIWHWRDWIVESVNKDKGYDRMLLEMLAADELYPTDSDALRATGFLARHYFKFNRTTWLDETIEHTGKAFLGLTMNCAKCHDHKYDPITHVDYYRFRAFFEPYQIRLDQVPGEVDLDKNGIPRVFDCNLDTPTFLHVRGNEQEPDMARKITPGLPGLLAPKGLDILEVALPLEGRHPGLRGFVLKDHLAAVETQLAFAKTQLAKTEAKAAVNVATKQIAALTAKATSLKARAEADRAIASNPDAPAGKEMARKAALAEKQFALAEAELTLANAEESLSKPKSDLAALKKAQAAVEAAQKELAAPGETYTPLAGALKTLESNLETDVSRRKPFPKTSTGRRSALAKWVASRNNPLTARVAVNHLWARHFGQPLVPSVFDLGRKGSAPSHPALLDWLAVEFMENGWSMKHLHRLLVTSSAYRMTSSLADAAASNREKDPDNRFLWRMNSQRMESQVVRDGLLHLAGDLDLTLAGPPVEIPQQEASKRRSLYFFHSAIDRNRFLATFDEADPLDCYRRRESIVPQQALALSNSKLALNAAEMIAKNLDKTLAKASDQDFARAAFILLLAEVPSAEEIAACAKAMQRWRDLHAKDGGQRARMLLVHALLNHNEFVTVR